jgi:tetratricopeptide (TPR) repeat protein
VSIQFILVLSFAFVCFAQNNIMVLEREIRGRADGAISVQLVNSSNMMLMGSSSVSSDGTFAIRDVNPGSYLVRFIGADNKAVRQGEEFEVSIGMEPSQPEGPSSTISAQTLARPPSKKALRYLTKAQRYSEAGNSSKAIEMLKSAPLDAASASYVHSRLGTEYLKLGQYTLALPELEDAARLAPKDSVHRSNLAYVYQALGRNDAAEAAARKALDLDGGNSKAHFLLGATLADKPATIFEAITHLKAAHRDVPSARFLLAQLYIITGQKAAADKELQSFLDVATDAQRTTAQRWLEVHRAREK